jgi:threonine aldolase
LKKITEEQKSLLACLKTSWVAAVEPVETNILIFLWLHIAMIRIEKLKQNISISSMGPGNLE